MQKMYLVKLGWNSSLLFEHQKEAVALISLLQYGKAAKSEYKDGRQFYVIDNQKDLDISLSVVYTVTQDELDNMNNVETKMEMEVTI